MAHLGLSLHLSNPIRDHLVDAEHMSPIFTTIPFIDTKQHLDLHKTELLKSLELFGITGIPGVTGAHSRAFLTDMLWLGVSSELSGLAL